MTNECDLDEVKHLAIEKLIEFSEKPELWTWKDNDYLMAYYMMNEYECEDFSISRTFTPPSGATSIHVKLDGITLASYSAPRHADVYNQPNMSAKEIEALQLKLIEFNEKPLTQAWQRIHAYHEAIRCEKQRQEIKRKQEETCRKIQNKLLSFTLGSVSPGTIPTKPVSNSVLNRLWRRLIR